MDSLQNSDAARPAENLEQLLHNFNPQLIITEKYEKFYVNVFGDLLKRLKNSVLHTDFKNQTYFITGQIGSGKTSALYKLERDLDGLNHSGYSYKTVHIDSRDFDPQDVDIEDLLIITGFSILKKIKDKQLNNKYLDFLDDLLKRKRSRQYEEIEVKKGKLEGEAGLQTSGGLPVHIFRTLGIDAHLKLKYDSEFRKQIRREYRLVQYELFNVVNTIINEIYQKYSDIRLILVFDDTEKLKGENAKNLFTVNLSLLTDLECIKIIMFPMKYFSSVLAQRHNLRPLLFTLRINQSPFHEDDGLDSEAKTSREILKNVILKRISDKHIDQIFENKDKIIKKVIDYSGGNLRQLISIIYNAAMEALSSNILKDEHINSAIKALRQTFSFVIREKRQIELLLQVKNKHVLIVDAKDDNRTEDYDKVAEELLYNNIVFYYYNDDIWYALNPVVVPTVERYSKIIEVNDA